MVHSMELRVPVLRTSVRLQLFLIAEQRSQSYHQACEYYASIIGSFKSRLYASIIWDFPEKKGVVKLRIM